MPEIRDGETPGLSSEDRRLKLSDERVVYRLCFEFLESHLEMAAKMAKDEITSEEAARAGTDLVQWMSWTLGGENPDFVPAPDWSGAPLGRYLRKRFAKELILLDEADRAHFEEDEAIIIFAMCQFMGEVHDLIEKLQTHTEYSTEDDAREYHELCVKWTEVFMNKPYRRIIVADG